MTYFMYKSTNLHVIQTQIIIFKFTSLHSQQTSVAIFSFAITIKKYCQ